MIVNRLQHDGMVRGDAVELRQRKAARLVDELLFRPAAQHHDPFVRRGFGNPVRHQLERAAPGRDPIEAQLVVLGGADPMRVIVDEAGNDGAAGEIDDTRRRSAQRLEIGGRADLDDALSADGERLGDGEAVIDRDDFAVDEEDVGRLRMGNRGVCQNCDGEREDASRRHGRTLRWLVVRFRSS